MLSCYSDVWVSVSDGRIGRSKDLEATDLGWNFYGGVQLVWTYILEMHRDLGIGKHVSLNSLN